MGKVRRHPYLFSSYSWLLNITGKSLPVVFFFMPGGLGLGKTLPTPRTLPWKVTMATGTSIPVVISVRWLLLSTGAVI